MASLKNYFLNLNHFESSNDDVEQVDEHQRRTNIISTRIYLILLLLTLIILTIVAWLTVETTVITIENPSKSQFESLPFDAYCPCSRISILYSEFTSIEATFHQVCSSDFVSNRWIKAIYSGSDSTYFSILDFRNYGSAQFQALASFCRLSKVNVFQSIGLFNMTSVISSQVQSETVFYSQVEAYIEQFQLTAPNQFATQLDLIREMIMSNNLISGLQTNHVPTYTVDSNDEYNVADMMVTYPLDSDTSCSCATDIDCHGPSYILNIFGEPTRDDYYADYEAIQMTIPGILSGCTSVNSLLLSTLECFYDQTCIDELLSYFPSPERFTAMVLSETSHFASNPTIKTLVDQLMVEEWITNISYDKYYDQCAPISCTYSIVERHNVLFILRKLISSLVGYSLFRN